MLSSPTLKISTRTAILFLGGFFLLVVFSIALTSSIFLNEIKSIELRALSEDVTQAKAIIDIKKNDMAKRIGDWAFWDETYDLIEHGDPQYTERNLGATSLNINDVDYMLFLNRRGEPLLSAELIDKDQAEQMSVEHISQILNVDNGISRSLDVQRHQQNPELKSTSGIILVDHQPTIVAFSPVTDSTMATPVIGWLVWAKKISEFFPERYKDVIGYPAQLLSQNDQAPAPLITPLWQGTQETAHTIHDGDLEVYGVLKNMNDQPVALLKLTTEREYFTSGLHAVYLFVTFFLLGSILIAYLFIRSFKVNVTSRLHDLEANLKKLAEENYATFDINQQGDEIGMVNRVVNQLLTNQQQTNHTLNEIENKFSAIYENAAQPMMIVYEKKILSANQAALSMLGFDSLSELQGHPLQNILQSDQTDLKPTHDFFLQLYQEQTRFEWDLVGNLGWLVPCLIDVQPIEHHGHQAWLFSLTDVSEKRLHENKIRRLVFNDGLTGLQNRYALTQKMQPMLEQNRLHGTRFAMLYININRFRAINDTFGHDIGDGVIKHIALRLSVACEQHPQQSLYRIAGDEFVVLIPQIENSYRPIRFAYSLNKMILTPMVVQDISIEINAAVSVIIGDEKFELVEDVLRCADFAMVQAKRQNKPVLLFTHSMYLEALETLTIQRDLPNAIRNGDVFPVYQPIVESKTGEVIGFEALARWKHPELGMISPTRFIPIAEETNLIIELGEQILRNSCLFIGGLNYQRQQQKQSLFTIHVNFSAHHFSSTTLLEHLKMILNETAMDSKQLVIEITESMLIERPAESVRRMQQLKTLGIGLALDDFGTGYSALNTLSQYPLDIVKLDQSFIRRMDTSEQDAILVKAIVNMSKALGLAMVAEGVETSAQHQAITGLGVEEIQGYYFYKPMPEKEIHKLFLSVGIA